jgi:hypothetical protein
MANDNEFFSEGLFRIRGVGLDFDALDQRATAPPEFRRNAGSEGCRRQLAGFYGLAVAQRHGHGDFGKFPRPSRYLGLFDDRLVNRGPWGLLDALEHPATTDASTRRQNR